MSETSGSRGNANVTVNLIAAILFLALSVWTLVADFTFTSNFLLQPSWSLPCLWIFFTLWFLAALIFAVFPKRIFFTAAIFLTLRSSLGWPLSLATGVATACRTLDFLIVGVAVFFLVWLLTRQSAFRTRHWIRWQHSVITGVAWIGLSVGSLVTGLLGAASVLDELSNGFVQLTPRGISFTERVLQKGSQRVHLVGLAHIGESTFYDDLTKALRKPIEGRRLVLTEGVTDDKNLLPPGFKSGQTYKGFAEQLGLDEQKSFQSSPGTAKEEEKEWAENGVKFVNADIDISELPDSQLEALISLLKSMDSGNLLQSFIESSMLEMTAEEIEDLIVNGLIVQRNRHLMNIFEEQHRDFDEIYIPWGAAHLPDLERRFLSLGFSMISEKKRLGIGFGS